MTNNSMFNPNRPNSGGGGSGGTPTTVVNSLVSTSTTAALSANQGRILNETILAHEAVIASTTELGHVKVDGQTIKIDPASGVISSTATGSSSVAYRQAIIPTTIIDQVQWTIPFVDYKYPDDLLIVSQNSTLLNTDEYSITQNSDGVSWDVNYNYTPDPQYPLAPENNTMFIIMVKGVSGGSGGGSTFPQPAIKQFIAETLVDPVGGFHYKIVSYVPQTTDKFEINFNTTTLTPNMYTLSNDGTDTYVKLLVQESTIQSKNNVAGTIYRNFDAF